MLFRINDDITIKSDRYTFMICQDKGLTRFPKGVEAYYHKPIRYCRFFHEILESAQNIGVSICDRIRSVIDKEIKLFNFLKSIDNYDVLKQKSVCGCIIKLDGDCYVVKYSSYSTYHCSLGDALFFIWSLNLKENFGSVESHTYCTHEEIIDSMNSFECEVSNSFDISFNNMNN